MQKQSIFDYPPGQNNDMFDPLKFARPNIRALVPYSSARDEFKGEAKVFIDANENSLGSPLMKWYNRYPDPHQHALKEKIASIKGIQAEHIFLGNGSDEAIDILFRAFCTPGKDEVILCPPTYGMYEVSAHINDIGIRTVPLTSDFQLDLPAIEDAVQPQTKIIWLCSPNNPTGNALNRGDVEMLLNNFQGLVVVDEAYVNFSAQKSFIQELSDYPNLLVLQTLSKAWGLAALRVGMAFASTGIIDIMDKVKPPYNINQPAQELAMQALEELGQVNDMILLLVDERRKMAEALPRLPMVEMVYPSDANFLLVKMQRAREIYAFLLARGIVVRDRSKTPGCEGCLRITLGTPRENDLLWQSLCDFADQLELEKS
jgi:histidinol-phosphate aminotransferase